MSATRERTREVFGFKKENLENPNVILYQQEIGKLKKDYRELYEASKAWMDSLAKMKVEGELLSNAYNNFGQTTYHKEGINLSKIHVYLDKFNQNAKLLYDNVEDNYFKEIHDCYIDHMKAIDTHDNKTHHDKLSYEDASTVYHKPMYHEDEKKGRDRFNKMTTAQSVYQADYIQYMQLLANLESRTEYDIPLAFRGLMKDIETFFEKGRQDFSYIDLPEWRRSDGKDSFLEPTLNEKYTNWNEKREIPVVETETVETKEVASGSNTVYTTTKTTTTAPITESQADTIKSDLIGNPIN
ncbi:hypothetical protein DDB_G0288323 [Dictyostelium discoideum AX4]|uniref:BAR domain-containing protein n=1 Tax=Dictyostelium discoideum TaxID=44689 RepID=Q54J40_DICDI|nr:hypothetical protein DDB_G0288323 [Dictyostelium discoideum AX4]EAL63258.1 hypothetical protein DDB_G0288323 [Dictyostelium discoideum AX4]|eukprot:XP_636761.1 hypothetical protein DDB_G0288323 [Dictyostelium discoideum AX4]